LLKSALYGAIGFATVLASTAVNAAAIVTVVAAIVLAREPLALDALFAQSCQTQNDRELHTDERLH